MHVEPAIPADAPALADILFRAFRPDALLVGTCYPDTPANREWWANMIASHIGDSETRVFKVVLDDGDRGESGKAVAWAKWLFHHGTNDSAGTEGSQSINGQHHDDQKGEGKHGAVDPDAAPSPDMDIDACRRLADGQYAMRERLFGSGSGMKAHLWLNAIATDPSYQHRGAASLLIAQGCRLAEEEVTAGHGLDIFSACTTQANKNMHTIWERHGFEIVDSEPVEGELSVFAGLRRASKQER